MRQETTKGVQVFAKCADGNQDELRPRYFPRYGQRRSALQRAIHAKPGPVAQALIGHDSEAIHEHYVNVGRDALQKAAAVFPSI